MLTRIFLLHVLGIGISVAGNVDYQQDANHYITYPQNYYPEQYPNNPELRNPTEPPYIHFYHESPYIPNEGTGNPESASAPQQTQPHQASVSPVAERFGGLFPPMPSGIEHGTYGVQHGNPYEGPPGPGPFSPPPYGYPDPGFQTQTGFEGLLVPNTWYGLLPWGIEGVIIVIAGIIVFAIIVIAIIGLLAWLCGVKKGLPWIKKEEEEEARSRFGDQWGESFTNLSAKVLDAIENFNEVSLIEEDSIKKLV